MPRLTNQTYLAQRRLLVRLWHEREGALFSVLPPYVQHDLHDFYAPSELLTDAEALAHRAAMTNAFPSLPQKAGRAFGALSAHLEGRPSLMVERYEASTTMTHRVGNNQKARVLRLTVVIRPAPDVHYLAKALLRLALDGWDTKHPDVHLTEEIVLDESDDEDPSL